MLFDFLLIDYNTFYPRETYDEIKNSLLNSKTKIILENNSMASSGQICLSKIGKKIDETIAQALTEEFISELFSNIIQF